MHFVKSEYKKQSLWFIMGLFGTSWDLKIANQEIQRSIHYAKR